MSLATTTCEMKSVIVVSILATHGLLTAPAWGGRLMPAFANQARNCGSVRRMTVHSIHLWNLPPISKFIPPSCRSASPAISIVHMAPGTARSNNSCSRLTRNGGMAMGRLYLLNSGCAVVDPEFNEAGETGDGQQSAC